MINVGDFIVFKRVAVVHSGSPTIGKPYRVVHITDDGVFLTTPARFWARFMTRGDIDFKIIKFKDYCNGI